MARLRCSDVFGSLAWPHLPNGHQAVPVREELLDIGQGEITDGGSGKIVPQPRCTRIAHNAAGNDDTTRRAGASKIFDQPGDAARRTGLSEPPSRPWAVRPDGALLVR